MKRFAYKVPLRFLLILKGEDEGQPVAEGVMRLSAVRMIS